MGKPGAISWYSWSLWRFDLLARDGHERRRRVEEMEYCSFGLKE